MARLDFPARARGGRIDDNEASQDGIHDETMLGVGFEGYPAIWYSSE